MVDNEANKESPKYTVSNPHPQFGVDPNILNEFGHTVYPKWIDSKEKDKSGHPIRVIVKDEKEEAEITGKAAKKNEDWGGKK